MMIAAFVLQVVALAFILTTLRNLLVRAVKKKRCTATAEGVITNVREKLSTRKGITSVAYIPTARYAADGAEYDVKLARAYHPAAYSVGQAVEIRCNPGKPSEVNKMRKSNKADVVMMGVGLLIGASGIVLLMIQ